MAIYNSNKSARKNIRFPGYDYSSRGNYYVTICTHGRLCLFGKTHNHKIHLNDAGTMIEDKIEKICKFNNNVKIDTYVVMPNHVHMIVVIEGKYKDDNELISLPIIVKNIKTLTTRYYINGVTQNNWQPFYGKLWQRSYHDHIIRDEHSLNRIRKYIIDNPINWKYDKNNPYN